MRFKWVAPSDVDLKVGKIIDNYIEGRGEIKHTARFIAKHIKQIICNKKMLNISQKYSLNLYFKCPGLDQHDRRDALLAELNKIIPLACPKTGEFYGYKKCLYFNKTLFVSNEKIRTCIVTLKIPNDAKRSSALGNKCRCDKAFVVKIENEEGKEINCAFSVYDHNFNYFKGRLVQCRSPFNENRFIECSSGIHFFMTPKEAKNYML